MKLCVSGCLSLFLCGSLLSNIVSAMGAGDYYYVVSQRCQEVGLTDEQKDALTPDVLLFEIDPANISDYAVKINNDALSDYTEEGIDYLNNLQVNQIYTVGSVASRPPVNEHRFLLQKEKISYQTLAGLLNRFSQDQTEKGHFYRQLLSVDDKNATFLAKTQVKLFDEGHEHRLFLNDYSTAYYQLDKDGQAIEPAAITVSHITSLTHWLHPEQSQWAKTVSNGVCAEKPPYSHW